MIRTQQDLEATEDAIAILAGMLAHASELGSMDWLFVYAAFRRFVNQSANYRLAIARNTPSEDLSNV